MNEELLPVTLARVEGKLDRIDDRLANLASDREDHEDRIRSLEQRSCVTWKAFLSTLTVAAALVGSATPFLAQLYSR